MATIKLVVIFLLIQIINSNAARILAVFPTPSISHQVVFRPFTSELASRGHEVTVMTTDPQIPKGEAVANLTEIDLHDMSYKMWRDSIMTATKGSKDDLFTQISIGMNTLTKVFEMQMKTKEVQELITGGRKFDLLLAETCVRPALAFSHIFNIPAILVSSFGHMPYTNDIMGAPTHPILYPDILRQKISNLSIWDKIVELYNHYRSEYMLKKSLDIDNDMLKRVFGASFPTYDVLKNNVHMSFLNVHPIWENNRPVPPSVVYMGGIHQKPHKSLPQDLESYLNSSKNGVIYISFGTNVFPSMLPQERMQILIDVFSELPYDILWKYDKDELPGKPKNVKLSKWLPQSDLLKHTKIKLFITQGGLQSTDEAITAGVPVIGFPMLGDQWYNVEQYVKHKIGVRLDMDSLTKDKFHEAIQTVIEDKSYKENIIRLRSIMHDQPQTALDRAVWWTEYVLRHNGAKHLQSPTANITWAEYLELELVTTVLLSVITLLVTLVILLRYLYKLVVANFTAIIKVKIS